MSHHCQQFLQSCWALGRFSPQTARLRAEGLSCDWKCCVSEPAGITGISSGIFSILDPSLGLFYADVCQQFLLFTGRKRTHHRSSEMFILSWHQVLQEKVAAMLIAGCGFLWQKWNHQKWKPQIDGRKHQRFIKQSTELIENSGYCCF